MGYPAHVSAPKSDDWPRAGWSPNTPIFGVRFESHDDFLVEYADHLRHGILRLPLWEGASVGAPVRVRLTLPDDVLLYVRGRLTALDGPDARIRLEPLAQEQESLLRCCVDGLLGHTERLGASGAEERPRPLSVLLVDDSMTQRLELGDALRARGLRVRVADNGLAGLSAALKRPPDVILTDVEMPQMDGWAFLRAVRQRLRLMHVPVVFLTRLSDDLSRLRGYRMGVDDYLGKQTPPDEIVAHLRCAVARRELVTESIADPSRSLRGNLEHVRLGSLLAFLETERRSGVLRLHRECDHATLHLREGELMHLEGGGGEDVQERAIALLEWRSGQFEFFAGSPDTSPLIAWADTDATSLSFLLMEHARRTDEAKSEPTLDGT